MVGLFGLRVTDGSGILKRLGGSLKRGLGNLVIPGRGTVRDPCCTGDQRRWVQHRRLHPYKPSNSGMLCDTSCLSGLFPFTLTETPAQ